MILMNYFLMRNIMQIYSELAIYPVLCNTFLPIILVDIHFKNVYILYYLVDIVKGNVYSTKSSSIISTRF